MSDGITDMMREKESKQKKMKTKKWKPKSGEIYYIPCFMWYLLDTKTPYLYSMWTYSIGDKSYYKNNLICKTKSEAIALAKAMLKVAERRGK